MNTRIKAEYALTLLMLGFSILIGPASALAVPCGGTGFSDRLIVTARPPATVGGFAIGCEQINQGPPEGMNVSLTVDFGGAVFKRGGSGRADIVEAVSGTCTPTGIISDSVFMVFNAAGTGATITMSSDATISPDIPAKDIFGFTCGFAFDVTSSLFVGNNPGGLRLPITVVAISDTPEPGTLLLVSSGLVLLVRLFNRRRNTPEPSGSISGISVLG